MLQKKRIRNHILTTFNHHLLHSDKSTYFYNNKHSDDNNKKQRYKLSYSHSWQTIPLVCSSFALLGLGIVMVNPSTSRIGIGSSNGTAYATTVTDNPAPYASIAFSLANSSNEELNDGDAVSSEVIPGLVNYIDTYINIRTSKINRYYVGVQAATDGNSTLTNTTTSTTINPVTANTKPDSFNNNTWGYALGETSTRDSELSYNPLPAYSTNTPVQYTSPSNLADGSYQLKLTFAAKINANQPAGHYTTKAIVSVAADAKEIATDWDTLKYMQDMTTDICNATVAPTAEDINNKTYEEIIAATPSKQLKDSRDGKYYWVSKLADGNCWMTQNLDFDIPTTLSSADTDIQKDEEGTVKTITTDTIKVNKPSEWTTNGNDSKYNVYYDPGDYIYNGPSNNHSQGSNCNASNSISDALSSCSQFTKSAVDNTSAQVLNNANRHYHVGNYYSWPAATVKSGDDIAVQGTPAPNSICPIGWQLPVSGIDTNNVLLANDKTFAKLFETYGWSWNKGYYTDTLNGGTNYYIYNTPFYFVYSGNLYSSSLRSAGSDGYYWSSTAISDATAYSLMLRSNAAPAGNSGRYSGYSVRCVAR